MHSRRTFLHSALAAPLASAAVPSDPADLTVSEAATLLEKRKLTPEELTTACLKRIDKLNPSLNAMIAVLSESAIARARSLQSSSAATDPLHGIPIALKDLYDTAGVRTTAASAHWRDRVPKTDATVVRRLHATGSILVGKANMGETSSHITSRPRRVCSVCVAIHGIRNALREEVPADRPSR